MAELFQSHARHSFGLLQRSTTSLENRLRQPVAFLGWSRRQAAPQAPAVALIESLRKGELWLLLLATTPLLSLLLCQGHEEPCANGARGDGSSVPPYLWQQPSAALPWSGGHVISLKSWRSHLVVCVMCHAQCQNLWEGRHRLAKGMAFKVSSS